MKKKKNIKLIFLDIIQRIPGEIHITIRKLIDSILPKEKIMLDVGPGKEIF